MSEVVRIGGMVESGRLLDAVCRELACQFTYERWLVDLKHGWIVRDEAQVDVVEVDAIEGDTIIEVKDLSLCGGAAKHLVSILKREDMEEHEGRYAVPFSRHSKVSNVVIAADIANQLLRYRTMIDEEVAHRLELHVASNGGIHPGVVDAMYGMFEKGTFELIWYADLLSAGIKLLPNPSIKDLRPLLVETVSENRSLSSLVADGSGCSDPFVRWVLRNEMIGLQFGDLDRRGRVRELRKLVRPWKNVSEIRRVREAPTPWVHVVGDEVAKEFFREMLRIHAGKYLNPGQAWSDRTVWALRDGDVFKVLAAIRADSVVDNGLRGKIRRMMPSLALYPDDDFWFFKYGDVLLDILKQYIYLTRGRGE